MPTTTPAGGEPATGTARRGAPDVAGRDDAEALLPLALSQPREALAIANHLIAGESDPTRLSVAYQAAGIVLRESGRHSEAVDHLRAALRSARKSGDPRRLADVQASMGVTLANAGKTAAALRYLDAALGRVNGLDRARVRLRRAHVLARLGRADEALADLRLALAVTRREGDHLWQARCLVHRSWARWALGLVAQAESDAEQAQRLFVLVGQHHEAAWTVNNRAYFAFYRGDLPRALALVDEAERLFAQTGDIPAHPRETRCRVLLAAGLAPEALEVAVVGADDERVPADLRTEFRMVAASAALAAGDSGRSAQLAGEAGAAFARHKRDRWLTRSKFVQAQARSAAGELTARDLRPAVCLAARLTDERAPEAPLAHVFAGRLALSLGNPDVAERELEKAAATRHTGSALARSTGWLASALRCAAASDQRGMRRACRRGLDALDDYRTSFGDVELRALATGQGRELAELALSAACDASSARSLLWWSERWRATALMSPPVHPPQDAELAAALAAAREAGARLADPAADPAALARAARDRTRHEAAVRRRTRVLQGATGSAATIDIRDVVEAVGTDALVSLVDVRGCLYAVLVTNGTVRRHEVGPSSIALRESEFARFSLRRTAYGRRVDLAKVGATAQSALLGPLAGRLPERVVLVPPAALHAAPWGLLPALAEARLSVAPSARLWLQARARAAPANGRVVVVTGPGLTSEASEATLVSTRYTGATVLSGAEATVAATVPALEGARLAHLAAHGTFRADAPMFSSLHLADGPLHIHDLDSLRRPPHTLILSACDAGDTAAVGVDEGLGLVTSLLGLGTSSVLASVVPVSDTATIPVMALLHARLAAGDDLATALREARIGSRGNPGEYAAAASFTAWAP